MVQIDRTSVKPKKLFASGPRQSDYKYAHTNNAHIKTPGHLLGHLSGVSVSFCMLPATACRREFVKELKETLPQKTDLMNNLIIKTCFFFVSYFDYDYCFIKC